MELMLIGFIATTLLILLYVVWTHS